MKMENKPKKLSTYDMLKSMDKKVQQNKNQRRNSNSRYYNDHKKRRSESPRDRRPSKKIPEVISVEDDIDYDVPDRTFGDLYCKACDSHMNSDQMWEAHIQGKRHQKHIRRGEQGEQKYLVLEEDPLILADIKKSTEPIIGLKHCCEMRRLEGRPIYQCFLCSANLPNGQAFLEHVVGLKHRMAYLKEHDPVKHDLIDKTNLKKGMIEPVVAECIRLHQDKHGTGIMQVKMDKSKPAPPPPSNRKQIQDDPDDNLKKDDRRYPEERNEDSRYNKQTQDYQHQRPRLAEDRFDDRHPYNNMRDRSRYSPERFLPPRYPRDEFTPRHMMGRMSPPHMMDRMSPPRMIDRRSPPRMMDRRSPPPMTPYDRGYRGLDQQSGPQWQNAPPAEVKSRVEEGRNLNLFQSLLKIIETMPDMMFLEIVLHRLEKMNPSEGELAMLQKIGNHMISIVMNEKLQKLSPDLLGKYQGGNTKPEPVREQSNSATNNLSSLMSLVSQFNSAKAASPSFNWTNQNAEPENKNAPAFMTSNSSCNQWNSSATTTEIPGLTLSSSSNNEELPQQRVYNSQEARAQFWESNPSVRQNNF